MDAVVSFVELQQRHGDKVYGIDISAWFNKLIEE
jgi:hypothetical protein